MRRQDLRRLGHEVHATKDDHIRGGLGGFARQLQAIADEICYILDFTILVVMRQDDGIEFALQPRDLRYQIDRGRTTAERKNHGGQPMAGWRLAIGSWQLAIRLHRDVGPGA